MTHGPFTVFDMVHQETPCDAPDDRLFCEVCGVRVQGEDGVPVADPAHGEIVMACAKCARRLSETAGTYCNDGAALEPWRLFDFIEANAEDPECTAMARAVGALAVGERACVGMVIVTRLT